MSSRRKPGPSGVEQKLFRLFIGECSKCTLYVGVTSDLAIRVWQHKNELSDGFTKRYRIKDLVWYEIHEEVNAAITREKQIKEWKKDWKIELIEQKNPYWNDLYNDIATA